MPSTNISDILIDTGAYQAEYKPAQVEDKPLGCDLPDLIPGSVSPKELESIGLNLDCGLSFIPTPIFVTPHIPPITIDNLPCSDGFSFGGTLCFKINDIPVDSDHNDVGLIENPDHCGANLGGCINLELPEAYCPNGLDFAGNATISINGIVVKDQDNNPQKILLTEDTDGCGAHLDGNIDITIPDLICPNGFNFRGVSDFKINGITVRDNQGNPQIFELSEDPDGCGAVYGGTIDIAIPQLICPNGFDFGGDIDFQINGISVQDNTVTVVENQDGCGSKIDGHINLTIPQLICPNGFDFGGNLDFRINGISAQNNTVSVVENPDGCGANLSGAIDITIPDLICPNGFSFTGSPSFKLNGQDPINTDNSRVAKGINLIANQDNCGANLNGNIDLQRIPVYRDNWFPGVRYFPFDLVSFNIDQSSCSALALQEHVASSANHPSKGLNNWVTMGCDGTGGPSQAAPTKRNPYEVIKLNENQFTMHASSALMKEFDTNVTIDTKGLDERFTLKKDDLVYLEVVFDARDINLPVFRANIAKGRKWDNWDQTLDGVAHPTHNPGVYPKLYKFVKPNQAQAEADFIDAETGKFIDQTNIQARNLEIKELLFKVGAATNTTIATLPFNNASRYFKAYILIGYVIDEDGGDFSFTENTSAGQKKRGFVQVLKNHLMLQGITINNAPAVAPVPYSGPFKRQVPKPTATATPKPGNTFEITLTVVDPNAEIINPRIYYTIDGTDPYLTDKTTPKLTALIYDSTAKPQVPTGGKVKCFAVKPPFISSVLVTTDSVDTLPAP